MCTNTDFRLRRSNICNPFYGNGDISCNVLIPNHIYIVCAFKFHPICKYSEVLSPGVPPGNLHNKRIIVVVSHSCLTGNDVSFAFWQCDIIILIDTKIKTYRIACNVGRCDCMFRIVRCYGVGSVFKCNLFAIQCHGKFTCIGDGKLRRTIINPIRLNTGKYRFFGVGCLDITASTEFFVRIRIPYAGMGMADNFDISGDTDTTINDLTVTVVLKSFAIRKAVHQCPACNGDLTEVTPVESQRAVCFCHNLIVERTAGVNFHRTAGLHKRLAVLTAVSDKFKHAPVIYSNFTGYRTTVYHNVISGNIQCPVQCAVVDNRMTSSGVECLFKRTIEKLAVIAIAVYDTFENEIRCVKFCRFGNNNRSCDRTVGNIQVRALCNIESIDRVTIHIDGKAAGTDGTFFRHIVIHPENAAVIFFGIADSICKVIKLLLCSICFHNEENLHTTTGTDMVAVDIRMIAWYNSDIRHRVLLCFLIADTVKSVTLTEQVGTGQPFDFDLYAAITSAAEVGYSWIRQRPFIVGNGKGIKETIVDRQRASMLFKSRKFARAVNRQCTTAQQKIYIHGAFADNRYIRAICNLIFCRIPVSVRRVDDRMSVQIKRPFS